MKFIKPILFSFLLVLFVSCKEEQQAASKTSSTAKATVEVEPEIKSNERSFKFKENAEANLEEKEVATLDNSRKKVSKPKESTKKAAKVVAKKKAIKPKTQKKITEKKGRLSFNSDTYDFGFIDMGENVKHEFIFRNTGSKDVNIENVEASCGCTTPSFPFIPIEPGKTGKIGVYFKSEGRLGGQIATVTVHSDAEESEMELYLKGVVRTELVKKQEDSIVPDTMSNE